MCWWLVSEPCVCEVLYGRETSWALKVRLQAVSLWVDVECVRARGVVVWYLCLEYSAQFESQTGYWSITDCRYQVVRVIVQIRCGSLIIDVVRLHVCKARTDWLAAGVFCLSLGPVVLQVNSRVFQRSRVFRINHFFCLEAPPFSCVGRRLVFCSPQIEVLPPKLFNPRNQVFFYLQNFCGIFKLFIFMD